MNLGTEGAWTTVPAERDIRATRSPGERGALRLDSTVAGGAPDGLGAFQREWQEQIGDGFALPTFSDATNRDFRVRTRAARVGDAVTVDVSAASAVQTAPAVGGEQDKVRLFLVQRGAWITGGPADRHEDTVPAGQFVLRHVPEAAPFRTEPHTTARLLVLPASGLAPLLANRAVAGPARSPEMRLLTAHATMVHQTVTALSPAGVQAARATMIELAKAAIRSRFDDAEPRLAPVLAQAGKDLADRLLTDPDLSAARLARELNVSVRTLQRAFSAAGEPVSAYIRRRRLEEARLALTVPSGGLTVTEIAARWQFADGSHFTRVFKQHYGCTPTEYARMAAQP